jgi:hypothetical protein
MQIIQEPFIPWYDWIEEKSSNICIQTQSTEHPKTLQIYNHNYIHLLFVPLKATICIHPISLFQKQDAGISP